MKPQIWNEQQKPPARLAPLFRLEGSSDQVFLNLWLAVQIRDRPVLSPHSAETFRPSIEEGEPNVLSHFPTMDIGKSSQILQRSFHGICVSVRRIASAAQIGCLVGFAVY